MSLLQKPKRRPSSTIMFSKRSTAARRSNPEMQLAAGTGELALVCDSSEEPQMVFSNVSIDLCSFGFI